MDRWRAAGALLALAACFACSAAAPTASNQTALDLYEGAPEGCYYNFQHYGEGDRIMTNEPCLNCTCHNRMLMCYLRVCPFTKPIGQDCSVEKRADQCCPIVTCPDVPVDLLTSTSTSSPAEYGATGLGKHDKYGCSLHGKYFPEGSKVPPTPNKPCEHCYCIRNMTTCVMQECTLHVDGCTPIYHKDVCCPVRYSCDHPEDEIPLLDDMSTTVRPTPGFLLTTTTMSPVTQMTQDCVHSDQIIADGASITTEKACEHCYCMKGDIVCVVQECGAPMENEGKNCTSLPPREGQCCPDTYICEGDDISTEFSTESSTDLILETLTTLSPPRRGGVEDSGYRNEANEAYTEIPTPESELEGSGEELEPLKPTHEPFTPAEIPEEVSTPLEEGEQYIPVTSKSTSFEEPETITKEIDRNVIPEESPEQETLEPEIYLQPTHTPILTDDDKLTTKVTEDDHVKPDEDVSKTPISIPDSYDKTTTESVESLNTVPDVIPEQDHDKSHEPASKTTETPVVDEITEPYVTSGPLSEKTSEPEYTIPSADIEDEIEKETPESSSNVPELVTERESSVPETDIGDVTRAPEDNKDRSTLEPETDIHDTDRHTEKSESPITGTTSIPVEATEKLTTEPDHAQNTVADEDGVQPHIISSEETVKTTSFGLDTMVTEKITKQDILEPFEHITTRIPTETTAEPEKAFGPTSVPTSQEAHSTAEPDKGLNTIPSEIIDESSSSTTSTDKTKVSYPETTEPSVEPTEVDIKSSTTSEFSTPLLDNQAVTKGDQYTITTEPSFRKEDEAAIGTEKSKDESGPTTIKAEFVDEGLIPTSTHGEKSSTVSPIDDDITTIIPEYSEESDESKQPTTESVSKVSDVSEIISEKTTSVEEEANISSTEKAINSEIHEEPSRIPGEGDCLLNGVTYRNNTVVPSTNNCHTGCKCVSSIIKCDPIICSPPPDYMDNCQSIYDTPDSCCPTYVCDHPRETSPPQSDNQMSGTETPAPRPTIECRGDQCELTEPAKQSTDMPAIEHRPEISQCGPEGCEGGLNKPSAEQPGCADGKCELPETGSQMKPCEGDACKVVDEEMQLPQPCEGEECKKIEVPITQTAPCEGDSCAKVDCGINGCDSSDTVPSSEKQPQEIVPSDCKGDEPCRRKDAPVDEQLPSKCEGSDCKTDSISDTESPKPEKPVDEDKQSPITNAEMQPETTPITQLATEQVPTEHSTYVTTEQETITEKLLEVHHTTTEEAVSGHEENTTPTHIKSEETEIPMESETEKPVVKDENEEEEKGTKKPDDLDVAEHTSKPDSDYGTSSQPAAAISDDHTDKTGLPIEEAPTMTTATIEIHTDEQATVEEEGTEKPGAEDEHTDKPTLIEEKITKIPDQFEEHTGKPEIIEDTHKPAEPVKEGSTKMPDVYTQENTDAPSFMDKDITEVYDNEEVYTSKPLLVEDEGILEDKEPQTSKPLLVKEDGTKAPSYEEIQTAKTPLVDEAGTKRPDDEKLQTDKTPLTEEDGMKKPEDVDTLTEKPSLTEDDNSKVADDKETHTSKAPFIEEDGTEMPGDEDTQTDKIPLIGEDDSTKISDDQVTSKPPLIDENDTKISGDEDPQTGKPLLVEEEVTKIPDIEIENSDKPTFGEETSTKLTDISIKPTDKPSASDETIDTEKPSYIDEEYVKKPAVSEETEQPILIDEQSTGIPEKHDHTYRTDSADQEVTMVPETEAMKKPSITEESTDKPIVIDVEITKKPDGVEEQYTSKPDLVEEQSTKMPELVEPEHSDKPDIVETEGPKIHDGIEDQTVKSTTIEQEGTSRPNIVEEHTDKPSPVKDDSAMTPDSPHTHQPAYVEEDASKKPSLVAEEQTDEPYIIEDATTMPDISETETMKETPVLVEEELPEKEGDQAQPDSKPSKPELPEGETTEYPYTSDDVTRKSTQTDKDTMTPEIEDSTGTEIPHVTTEKTTVYPIDFEDKTKEKPLITEKEQEEPTSVEKDSVTESEENQTQQPSKTPEELPTDVDKNLPQAPSEEGSGAEAPDTYTIEPEIISETPVETYSETTSSDLEKATKIPIYETETTVSEEVAHTESFLETIDEHKPEEEPTQETATAGSLDDMSPHSEVSKPQESDTTEQSQTTKVPLAVTTSQDTSPPLQEGDESEFITPSQDVSLNEIQSSTKTPELMGTESAETVSKQDEVYTDMPEEPSSATKSPVNVPVEPQEGGQTELPDLTVTRAEIEVSTTKVDADIRPESHVTHSTSEEKVTKIPEIIDTDAKTTESPEPHDAEVEKMPSQTTESHLEKTTPEKEDKMTSTVAPEVTEPVKGFSVIEDVTVTSERETVTEIYGESTERLEPASHEKTDMMTESPSLSDTKTTKSPEELYTESHDIKEHPIIDTKPETGTELSKQPASTTELPDQSEITPESDKKTPDTSGLATDLPVFVVTESQEKPVEDIGTPYETTARTPDSPHEIQPDATTIPTKVYLPEEQATVKPESHITGIEESEQPKTTESSYVVPQETDLKSEEPELPDSQKTTIVPEISPKPEEGEVQAPESHDVGVTEQPTDVQKSSTEQATTFEEMHTELPHVQMTTEASLSLVTESRLTTKHEAHTESHEVMTEQSPAEVTLVSEYSTKAPEKTSAQSEFSETTPYLIELEEHTHKKEDELSTISPLEEEQQTDKSVLDISTLSPTEDKVEPDVSTQMLPEDEHVFKTDELPTTAAPSIEGYTYKIPENEFSITPSVIKHTSVEAEEELPHSETTDKVPVEEIETATKLTQATTGSIDETSATDGSLVHQTTLSVPVDVHEKLPETSPTEPARNEEPSVVPTIDDQKDVTTPKSTQAFAETTLGISSETERSPIPETDMTTQTEKESEATDRPLHLDTHIGSTVPEDESILSTTKATTIKQEEILTTDDEDKYSKPEEKPTSEVLPPSPTAEVPKPPTEMQPTDDIPTPDDDGHFPTGGTGYGEPDYVEEDQAFGPGTCRYGGKVYVSAQQIPRDDPCDFCFCFRSDIICLQQSCPPPIHGCHEEPIQGFCCPRYECPVSMATSVNVTTTTTTTTTTLPPHFPTHSYKGAAQRRGCQIKGHTYKVGEVVRSSSGPCLHCTCGGDGQMKCDPKACTPEPMLRQMIAAAVSAKRRR